MSLYFETPGHTLSSEWLNIFHPDLFLIISISYLIHLSLAGQFIYLDFFIESPYLQSTALDHLEPINMNKDMASAFRKFEAYVGDKKQAHMQVKSG